MARSIEITGPVFESGRQRLLRHRLPLFALGWCTTTIAWGAALMLQSRLSIFPASLLFTFQLGILIAAIAICHAKASASHVPLVVLAACVLLGLSSTGLFAAIGGYGEMLLFLLLTLFLASTPLFAWSGRAALVLIVGTLLPWLIALPFLHFVLRPANLAGAIAASAIACLVTLRWSQRRFQQAVVEIVATDARRAAVENAAHVMFAVDAAGRFVYANGTLASLVGISTDGLLGQSFTSYFAAAETGESDTDLARATQRPDGVRWTFLSAHGPRSFHVIAWVSKGPDGEPHATYVLGREVAEIAPMPVAAPAAPVPPPNEFAVLQEPLRLIGDEEVRHLREEVGRLRREVLEQNGSAPGRPRGRRSSRSTSGVGDDVAAAAVSRQARPRRREESV